MPRRKVFITVAEVSADFHGANLIQFLRAIDPEIEINAVGGPRMAEAGATLVYESVGDAAMGWRGALRTFEVLRLLRETRERFEQQRPDLHICIDSSAMNLPFAKLASSMNVPVLYYVAPQLWASREGRMKQLRAYVDRVACILPFEQEYFRRHGVDATFVGHPLFDEIPTRDARETASGGREVSRDGVTVGIVAGSRRGEIVANLPHLVEVADAIRARYPAAKFLLPTTASTHDSVSEILRGQSDHFQFRLNGFDEMIPRCDLCLCKSGTSTLHVAAYGVPMIVVYRLNPLLWYGLGRWIIKTDKISLVNILAGHADVVPEFAPWFGSNQPVIDCALELLANPVRRDEQRRKLLDLIHTLDQPGASMNAAKIAMEMIGSSNPDFDRRGLETRATT